MGGLRATIGCMAMLGFLAHMVNAGLTKDKCGRDTKGYTARKLGPYEPRPMDPDCTRISVRTAGGPTISVQDTGEPYKQVLATDREPLKCTSCGGGRCFRAKRGNGFQGYLHRVLFGLPPAAPEHFRIINGVSTSISEWPFFATVWLHYVGTEDYTFKCGASLVKSDAVVTAAHCVDDGDPDIEYFVRTGADQLIGGSLSPSSDRVSAFKIHPQYTPWDEDNSIAPIYDVAVLRLENARNGIETIPIACGGDPGTVVTIVGHGGDDQSIPNGDLNSEQLEKASVTLDVPCNNLMFNGHDPIAHICSGTLGPDYTGKRHCAGDSGGPLVGADGWLHGVISFGPESLDADQNFLGDCPTEWGAGSFRVNADAGWIMACANDLNDENCI